MGPPKPSAKVWMGSDRAMILSNSGANCSMGIGYSFPSTARKYYTTNAQRTVAPGVQDGWLRQKRQVDPQYTRLCPTGSSLVCLDHHRSTGPMVALLTLRLAWVAQQSGA